MTPERWQQVKELFRAALEHDAEERAEFLERACNGDDELRQEVESLLASFADSDSVIEKPLAETAAELLSGDKPESLIGQQLSHYEITGLLGEGGMGTVYLAHDARLGRKVAVKLLPPYFTGDQNRLYRFEQEARAASALNHPNIITIHEIGESDSGRYLVTEFVEGQTLRERLTQSRMGLSEALAVITQVASALAAAHEAGIVHRDIKPENLMIRRDGLVKVLDFGLAKLTESQQPAVDTQAATAIKTDAGVVMGTVRYMSPEQARGQKVDARTDIFSLGVVLYEMVTGEAPFEGASAGDVIAAILITEPPPLAQYAPDLPVELDGIVTKSLAKDKEKRYQVVEDLLLDLRRLKQQLEFETQHGSVSQTIAGEASVSQGTARADIETTKKPALSTAISEATRNTSSAEYLFTKIKRRGTLLVLFALLAILAAIGYWAWGRKARPAFDSIAILPLTNASGDASSEYLSDGITENIINSLTQLSGLKVTARTTVFRYKGKDIDAQEAGRQLKVDAVMTGKVIQQGETLIVQADLVNVADGTQIWGDKYNGKLSDILTVQEEIAKRISEKLRLKLTGAERERLTKPLTENTEAYQLYLKGRYHLYKPNKENAKKALDYFEQAIAKDPTYALAYAGLADSYAEFQRTGINLLPAKEAMPKAKQAATKALELDNQLAEAHISLAKIKQGYEWDWAGAETEYKRAIELNPNLTRAHYFYGQHLSMMGRHSESIAELKRSLEIDPLDLDGIKELGYRFFVARQYDQASEQFRKVLDMDPNSVEATEAHNGLAWIYERKGMYEEALSELSKTNAGEYRRAIFGWVYASSGKKSEAQKIIEELKAQSRNEYISPYLIAMIYARLGDKDQTLQWLEKAYESRDNWMVWIKVDPGLDILRSDPRFIDLLHRIGLPQ
ncbi:MAG TPA: protein kinase [Pyrinomonadaceae bacterium]